jgi:hypothetical protein
VDFPAKAFFDPVGWLQAVAHDPDHHGTADVPLAGNALTFKGAYENHELTAPQSGKEPQ